MCGSSGDGEKEADVSALSSYFVVSMSSPKGWIPRLNGYSRLGSKNHGNPVHEFPIS